MAMGKAPKLWTQFFRVKKAMGFFDSEIVQNEAKQLFTDYQNLVELGSGYGKFDREGKKMFIDQMETLMDRYKIFMKRFELSDDFMAQMTVQQMNTQLGQFGMTPQQMFDQMRLTLERMKSEIKE
jgi:hypothetical protein